MKHLLLHFHLTPLTPGYIWRFMIICDARGSFSWKMVVTNGVIPRWSNWSSGATINSLYEFTWWGNWPFRRILYAIKTSAIENRQLKLLWFHRKVFPRVVAGLNVFVDHTGSPWGSLLHSIDVSWIPSCDWLWASILKILKASLKSCQVEEKWWRKTSSQGCCPFIVPWNHQIADLADSCERLSKFQVQTSSITWGRSGKRRKSQSRAEKRTCVIQRPLCCLSKIIKCICTFFSRYFGGRYWRVGVEERFPTPFHAAQISLLMESDGGNGALMLPWLVSWHSWQLMSYCVLGGLCAHVQPPCDFFFV